MTYETTDGLIDVHAHFLPPWYVQAAIAAGHHTPDGMPSWPTWNVDEHLRLMDTHGIEQAVLSLSSPGVHFGDDAAAAILAARVNDYAANLVAARPDRFKFFAVLPLPAVDTSLREVARALDTLGAAGVIVASNAGGTYLGDAAFEPVWQQLDQRAAPVFIHPTSPAGWQQTALGLPRPMMEFLFDTTRAVVGLGLSGTLARHPKMRVIVPHCGATLPVLAPRIELFEAGLRAALPPDHPAHTLPAFGDTLSRLWYDLAGTPMPTHAATLTDAVGPDHLLFGSDYCFTPPVAVAQQIAALDAGWANLCDTPWRQLTAGNARVLLDAVSSPAH
jgi:predicted TIM-barrel fold metal-dependent hydrolase